VVVTVTVFAPRAKRKCECSPNSHEVRLLSAACPHLFYSLLGALGSVNFLIELSPKCADHRSNVCIVIGVAQLTLAGRLLTANEQMCDLIGQPKKNLLEKNLNQLLQPETSWTEWEKVLMGSLRVNYSTIRPI
jgi:PAS domain-containing protein